MRYIQTQHRQLPTSDRSAFTLVEMMVSIALVLLMMSMFASIFSMATNSIADQRGIAENDQRARALVTVFKSDFNNRTMRFPLPFHAGEDSSIAPSPRASSNGYLYISTNNPDSGHDDKLQLTVSTTALSGGSDTSPFFGAATILSDRSPPAAAMPTSLSINRNQPDADDGTMLPNGTAASAAAEITYFWRNGNLYRRVVLIREPQRMAGQSLGPQPVTRTGINYFAGLDNTGAYEPDIARYWSDTNLNGVEDPNELSNNFMRDFDFSAIRTPIGNQSARFIGLDSLGNGLANAGAAVESLGNPVNRFGFDNLGAGFGSRSREFDSNGRFFGCYLQAETSARNFNWPQAPARTDAALEDAGPILGAVGNPFDIATPVNLNPTTGLINEFSESAVTPTGIGRGGTRRNEDLLLSNVHEFRVELWDERLQRFVTPGHLFIDSATGAAGDYHFNRCLNAGYGPSGNGAVFDTFHPTALGEAPYIAYRYYPPQNAGAEPGPSPAGMPGPFGAYWTAIDGTGNPMTYAVGDIVFARPTMGFDATPGFQWNGDVMPPQGFQIAYRCVTAGPAGGIEPLWPVNSGHTVPQQSPLTAKFESFDNRRPLQSVRLTVRFHDRNSDKLRQTSLILSVNDSTK